MAAPGVLGYGDPARSNDRVMGPLVANMAFIAVWEVLRGLRRASLALGAWLLLAPWVLGYAGVAETANSVGAGILVLALASVRGRVSGRYGAADGPPPEGVSGRRPASGAGEIYRYLRTQG
jgi:hypothetical protein